MRRVSALLLAGSLVLGTPGLAYANHGGGDRYGYDERGNCNREGNCNDQDRCSGDGCTDNHKSFSPDLKDSPVTICMPGSRCYFDGRKNGDPPNGPERPEDPS